MTWRQWHATRFLLSEEQGIAEAEAEQLAIAREDDMFGRSREALRRVK